jgi:hypothetical protein
MFAIECGCDAPKTSPMRVECLTFVRLDLIIVSRKVLIRYFFLHATRRLNKSIELNAILFESYLLTPTNT